jgi:hypothetical protein
MKIEFNEQQLQVLNAALVELPFRVAAPLINHINMEIRRVNDEKIDKREELESAP